MTPESKIRFLACAFMSLFFACTSENPDLQMEEPGSPVMNPPGGMKVCGGCPDGTVCVEGRCEVIPRSCPCPKETYCDLATNTCKQGCTEDAQCSTGRICNREMRTCQAGCRTDEACGPAGICQDNVCKVGCRKDAECGAGNICEAFTCRAGCRKDAECTGMGEICDREASVCKPGCRVSASCPKEMVCDFASSKCVPGCENDARCNEGRICEMGRCTEGCRVSASCPTGSYCNPMTRKCVPGCNGDAARCAVGEACVRYVDGTHKCQSACHGYECNGVGWSCFATYSDSGGTDYRNARCRKACSTDADCAMGTRCTVFTRRPAVPGMNQVKYCALPCGMAGCMSALDGYAMPGMCTCAMDGACRTNMGMGYVCYQPSPSYGL